MSCSIAALCIDANDPLRLAHFWAGVLGFAVLDGPAERITLEPNDDTGFCIQFRASTQRKIAKNQMHFDLTSASLEDQQRTVDTALSLGARHIDIGQGPQDGHVVLADPEGNEFCVIEPDNAFLAECGLIGAISCDGSQDVGYFWSEALDWPLVWDQDQETAIRSPHGGPKITWGGPPFTAKVGQNRWHFDVVSNHESQGSEVDRLVSLGASRTVIGTDNDSEVVLADPDGNEFCVLRAS